MAFQHVNSVGCLLEGRGEAFLLLLRMLQATLQLLALASCEVKFGFDGLQAVDVLL